MWVAELTNCHAYVNGIGGAKDWLGLRSPSFD
jgi:hypothetical protein